MNDSTARYIDKYISQLSKEDFSRLVQEVGSNQPSETLLFQESNQYIISILQSCIKHILHDSFPRSSHSAPVLPEGHVNQLLTNLETHDSHIWNISEARHNLNLLCTFSSTDFSTFLHHLQDTSDTHRVLKLFQLLCNYIYFHEKNILAFNNDKSYQFHYSLDEAISSHSPSNPKVFGIPISEFIHCDASELDQLAMTLSQQSFESLLYMVEGNPSGFVKMFQVLLQKQIESRWKGHQERFSFSTDLPSRTMNTINSTSDFTLPRASTLTARSSRLNPIGQQSHTHWQTIFGDDRYIQSVLKTRAAIVIQSYYRGMIVRRKMKKNIGAMLKAVLERETNEKRVSLTQGSILSHLCHLLEKRDANATLTSPLLTSSIFSSPSPPLYFEALAVFRLYQKLKSKGLSPAASLRVFNDKKRDYITMTQWFYWLHKRLHIKLDHSLMCRLALLFSSSHTKIGEERMELDESVSEWSHLVTGGIGDNVLINEREIKRLCFVFGFPYDYEEEERGDTQESSTSWLVLWEKYKEIKGDTPSNKLKQNTNEKIEAIYSPGRKQKKEAGISNSMDEISAYERKWGIGEDTSSRIESASVTGVELSQDLESRNMEQQKNENFLRMEREREDERLRGEEREKRERLDRERRERLFSKSNRSNRDYVENVHEDIVSHQHLQLTPNYSSPRSPSTRILGSISISPPHESFGTEREVLEIVSQIGGHYSRRNSLHCNALEGFRLLLIKNEEKREMIEDTTLQGREKTILKELGSHWGEADVTETIRRLEYVRTNWQDNTIGGTSLIKDLFHGGKFHDWEAQELVQEYFGIVDDRTRLADSNPYKINLVNAFECIMNEVDEAIVSKLDVFWSLKWIATEESSSVSNEQYSPFPQYDQSTKQLTFNSFYFIHI